MTIITKALSFLIALLFTFNLIQHLHVTELQWQLNKANIKISNLAEEITKQNAAVKLLKIISDKQIIALNKAEKLSKLKMIASYKEAQALLNTKLSPICDANMQWGAKIGASLGKCWETNCH